MQEIIKLDTKLRVSINTKAEEPLENPMKANRVNDAFLLYRSGM